MAGVMNLPRPRPDWALFLDFDGCLVEIAPRPLDVHVDPALAPLLSRINAALNGALAIVSGRPIAEIDQFLASPNLPVAGLHGAERRRANGTVAPPPDRHPALGAIAADLAAFAHAHDGVMLEDKGVTLALHYRNAPSAEAACREVMQNALVADELVLLDGKKVLEIKPRNIDKGRALRAFMAEAPFAGRVPVYCGDDVTDEAGFAAVNEMGGVSIRVGSPAPTQAVFACPSVGALRTWLEELETALSAHDVAGSG